MTQGVGEERLMGLAQLKENFFKEREETVILCFPSAVLGHVLGSRASVCVVVVWECVITKAPIPLILSVTQCDVRYPLGTCRPAASAPGSRKVEESLDAVLARDKNINGMPVLLCVRSYGGNELHLSQTPHSTSR